MGCVMGIYTEGLDSELRTSQGATHRRSMGYPGTATTPFPDINLPKDTASAPSGRYPVLRPRRQSAASPVTVTNANRGQQSDVDHASTQNAASDVIVQDIFQELELENVSLVDSVTKDEIREMRDYLEQKYGMSSEEFLRRWKLGEMPDNFETNYWAILVK